MEGPVSMVAGSEALAHTVAQSPYAPMPVDSPAVDASIARYRLAGERVRGLADVVWKLCVGLMVLVALAWTLGILPGAVRLF